MSDLTEQEAAKFFEEVSKANRDGDSLALSNIMATEAPNEEPPVETPPADDTPVEDDNTDDKAADAADDNSPPSADDNANEEDEAPAGEPTEIDKLKEQLSKLSKENHALKSQAGRVPHVQRRIKELDRKLEELTKQTTSPSSQPSTKLQPKITEALKGIKETDPELADTIARVIAEATDGVASDISTRELESVKAQRAETYEAYQAEEANRLLEMFPNAREVFSDPTWKQWKSEQPPGIAALASSDNADDVAFAFKKYADDMTEKFPDLKSKNDEGKPPVVDAAKTAEAQRIEAERQRKKQTTPNVGNPSAAGKVSLPDDPQALFEKYSSEIRKSITG